VIRKAKKATLIEGDGIGPDITAATVDVIAAAGGQVEWERVPAGLAAVELRGIPLPEALTSIEKNGVALKGPLGTRRRGLPFSQRRTSTLLI